MRMTICVLASLLLMLFTAVNAQGCPPGCQCTSLTANNTVFCTGLSAFPQFPRMSMEKLDIRHSDLPEIAPNAVADLSGLRFIKIYNSKIGSIKPCAFNMLYLEALTIEESDIGIIESGAFRNISFVPERGALEMQNVTVKKINSYAFMSIFGQKSAFAFRFVNITVIKPAAFYDLYINTFRLHSSSIKHIRTTTFLHFQIDQIDIYDTLLDRLDCGAFFQGISRNYSVQFDVNCNCDITWIIADAFIQHFNQSKCREPAQLSGLYLSQLNETTVCPSRFYTRGCAIRRYNEPNTCPKNNNIDPVLIG